MSPGYLADIDSQSMADVRRMRAECQEVENDLSFVRRIAHGRLDIVGGEVARRRTGGDPSEISDLVDQLPGLMGEQTAPDSLPRPPQALEPSPAADHLVADLDEIVTTRRLVALSELTDDDLNALIDGLEAFESRISAQRRALHETIDTLQREIVERYRSGEASVDSLFE
jgi:hypothetical protein